MPKELSVSLAYQSQNVYAGTASPVINYFGMLEYLNNNPLYSAQLFQIYRYCKVTSVEIVFDVINTGATPLEVLVGTVPYVEVGALTATRLAEKTTTTRKLISPAGGLDKCRIAKFFSSESIIGEPFTSKFWMSYSQSLSTTPIDVNEPVIATIIAFAGSSGSVFAIPNYRIRYHCQFFDLLTPATS
jgi:hypothetical protein